MGHVSGPTSFKRQPRQEKKKGLFSGAGKGKSWAIALLASVIVFGMAGGIYAYMQYRVDPEVARVEQMMSDARDREATDEERRENWQQMQEAREYLTEEQRAQLDERMRAQWQAEREARMAEWQAAETERIAQFHTLSAEEQTEYLDEQIDRMVEWQEQAEERRREREAQRERQGESGDRGGERGPRGGGGDQARGGEGGNAQGGGEGRPQRDPEEWRERRQQGRRDRLAATTPEQRAQWANYREQMRKRMEERGIEFGGRGGPGGGRGPR